MVPDGKLIGQIRSPGDKTVNTNYHSLNAHLLTTPRKFADHVLEIDRSKCPGAQMAQVKKPAVREAILESAYMLFRDQGYNGTTLTQIATEAGISTANLYSYFGSKFDILYSIYDPWLRARLERLELEVAAIHDPRKRLKRLISVIWRDIPAEENSFANNIIQAVSGASSDEGYDPSLLKAAERFVARMLTEILPPDRLELVDVKSMSHVIFMAFDGFAMSAHVNPAASCGDKEIELLCALILGNTARSIAATRKKRLLRVK